jgi:hypothetical protein
VHSGQLEGGATPHGTRNAALVAASEDVWVDSEEEEEVSPPYPVLLEKVETVALDPSCQGELSLSLSLSLYIYIYIFLQFEFASYTGTVGSLHTIQH